MTPRELKALELLQRAQRLARRAVRLLDQDEQQRARPKRSELPLNILRRIAMYPPEDRT